jgi:hypothetical protein
MLLRPAQQLDSVQLRHHDVGDDQRDVAALRQHRLRRDAVFRLQHIAVPERLERPADQSPHQRVVVHHQHNRRDCCGFRHAPSYRRQPGHTMHEALLSVIAVRSYEPAQAPETLEGQWSGQPGKPRPSGGRSATCRRRN